MGIPGVGIEGLRHNSVLGNEVHDHVPEMLSVGSTSFQHSFHIPLSAIAHWARHESADKSAVYIFIHGIQDRFEVVVCLLDLVPKEEIALRELKVLDLVLLLDSNAEDVAGGENPTPPAAFLVCDLMPVSMLSSRCLSWYTHRRSLVGNGDVVVLCIPQHCRRLLQNCRGVVGAQSRETELVLGVLEKLANVLLCSRRVDMFGIVRGEEKAFGVRRDAVVNLQGIELLVEAGDKSRMPFTSRDGASGELWGRFGVAHDP